MATLLVPIRSSRRFLKLFQKLFCDGKIFPPATRFVSQETGFVARYRVEAASRFAVARPARRRASIIRRSIKNHESRLVIQWMLDVETWMFASLTPALRLPDAFDIIFSHARLHPDDLTPLTGTSLPGLRKN